MGGGASGHPLLWAAWGTAAASPKSRETHTRFLQTQCSNGTSCSKRKMVYSPPSHQTPFCAEQGAFPPVIHTLTPALPTLRVKQWFKKKKVEIHSCRVLFVFSHKPYLPLLLGLSWKGSRSSWGAAVPTVVPTHPLLQVLLLREQGRTGEGASRGRSPGQCRLRAVPTRGAHGGPSPSPSLLCFSPPESWEPKRDLNPSTSSWIPGGPRLALHI